MQEGTKRPSAAFFLWRLTLLIVLVPALYPLGYFFRSRVVWLVPPPPGVPGRYVPQPHPPTAGHSIKVRVFPSSSEASFFLPASIAENWWRGEQMLIFSQENFARDWVR
jgi:hypothetical protein